MKIINKLIYTDKQYIEILEKKIKEHKRDYYLLIERHNKLFNDYKELEEKNKTFEDYNKDLNNQLDKLEGENKKKLESIANLIKDNADLQLRINKAVHLINHNDITDYRVFETDLLKILKGEE